MALHREASEEHRIASVQEMASQSAQRKRELPRHRPGISERGPRLTRREQIVALLMEGCANKEIAARLATSEQTIKNQLSTLYQKAHDFAGFYDLTSSSDDRLRRMSAFAFSCTAFS